MIADVSLTVLTKKCIDMCVQQISWIAIIFIGTALSQGITVDQLIPKFLADNGFHFISVVENATVPSKANMMLTRAIAKNGVSFIRTIDMDNYLENYSFDYLDVEIFLLDVKNDNIPTFLNSVSNTPVGRSIIFLKSFWTPSEEATFKKHLDEMRINSLFYLCVPSQNDVAWFQVITLSSG